MAVFITMLHTLVCVLLATIILMQAGRGGGLTEGFASADSVFGAQTNEMLIKGTTVLATVFLVTCLSLAFMSTRKNESLMGNRGSVPAAQNATTSAETAVPALP